MEEFKSNSMKTQTASKTPSEQGEVVEKRVKNQIAGTASTKKKNGMVKFAEVFLPEDTSSVKDYIIRETTDILVTALKKSITSAVNSFLYGNSNAPSSGGNYRSSGMQPSYRSYYEQNNQVMDYRPRTGSVYSFDEVEFCSVKDVEDAIRELRDIQYQYRFVRIADMYEVARLENLIRFTDNNYGWYDVSSARWEHYVNRDGEDRYVLKMPRPQPR